MDVSAETITTDHATDHASLKAGHLHLPHHHKHHGLGLLPPPSDDPRDPLRWPRWMKIAALLVAAMTNFTANFAGAGLSVAMPALQAQYQKSANQANMLVTFNFLLLGFGNMFWVPLAVKFGKRFALLTAMAMLFAVLIWTAKIDGFNSFLAARCLSGFASAAGESIVPAIVSDLFFLHERAAMMAGYTILISSATGIGPLVAALIVQYSPGGWVDYIWVCAALAGFNLVLLFLLYPESNFNRPELPAQDTPPFPTTPGADDPERKPAAWAVEDQNTLQRVDTVAVVDKSLISVWTTFITIDHSVSLFRIFLHPLLFLLCPDVLYAVFVYGVSLAVQIVLIFAFPNLLLAPPYLFTPVEVGLIQIAAIIGFILACFAGGYVTDVITARVILRHGGQVFPEQRLLSLLSAGYIAPVGCIVIAFACANKLTWVAIAFGFGMVSFGTVFAPNIVITYVVESRPKHAGEAIVAINVFKNLVGFLFLYVAVDWVAARGWIEVYMIMFMLVTLAMLLAIPFYFYGAKFRKASSWVERFL